eukprot:4694134-Amphidinium_carterae.2
MDRAEMRKLHAEMKEEWKRKRQAYVQQAAVVPAPQLVPGSPETYDDQEHNARIQAINEREAEKRPAHAREFYKPRVPKPSTATSSTGSTPKAPPPKMMTTPTEQEKRLIEAKRNQSREQEQKERDQEREELPVYYEVPASQENAEKPYADKWNNRDAKEKKKTLDDILENDLSSENRLIGQIVREVGRRKQDAMEDEIKEHYFRVFRGPDDRREEGIHA